MKKLNLLIVLSTVVLLFSCGGTQKKNQVAVEKNVKTTSPNLANEIVDVFEQKFGVHKGKRRNHIDGFCFSGKLTLKDENIKKYSKSAIFNKNPLDVTGRFSHKGGVKKNESKPGEYGMAFRIQLANGSVQDFSMNTLDFFPANTPEGFLQLMKAKISGKKEDFDKLKIDHPEFAKYKSHYGAKPKKVLRPYANHQFNSINTFLFENKAGNITPVRWSFVPKNNLIELDKSVKNDFFLETQKSLKKGKLVWEMIVTIANPDDEINDASILWEGKHEQIVAATLTIDEITKSGDCDDMMFNPLTLQPGIKPSEDPILKFRSPSYIVSFSRRLQEKNN